MPLERVRVGDRLRVRPGEKVPVDGVVLEGDERRRRVDGQRGGDPGGEAGGRPRHRGDGQRHGQPGPPRRTRGGRHPARPDREDGQRGPAQPRPHPAPGRCRIRLVRGGRDPRGAWPASSSGPSSAPSRGWPTPSCPRWACSSSRAPARWVSPLPCPLWSGWGRARPWACSSATRKPSRPSRRWTRWWWTRPAPSPKVARSSRRSCPLPGRSEDEVLRLAAAVERGSEHPLAAAIVTGAQGAGPHHPAGHGVPIGHGSGRDRHRGRPERGPGQPPTDGRPGRGPGPPRAPGRRAASEGRDRHVRGGGRRGGRPRERGRSRSRARPARPCACSTRTACAW